MANDRDIIEVITDDNESNSEEDVKEFVAVSKGKENLSRRSSKKSIKQVRARKPCNSTENDEDIEEAWIARRNRLAKRYKRRQKIEDKDIYKECIRVKNNEIIECPKLQQSSENKKSSGNIYKQAVDIELKRMALLRIQSELQNVMKNSRDEKDQKPKYQSGFHTKKDHRRNEEEKNSCLKKSNSWCSSADSSKSSTRNSLINITRKPIKSTYGIFRYPKHFHHGDYSHFDSIESRIPFCMKKSVQHYSKAPLCQKSFYNPWGSIAYVHKHEIHTIPLPHPNKKNRNKAFDEQILSNNRKRKDSPVYSNVSELEKSEQSHDDDYEENDEYENDFDNKSIASTQDRSSDDERPDYERPDDERPDDERPDYERPDDERPGDERPDDERPDDERPDESLAHEHLPDDTHVIIDCCDAKSDKVDKASKKSKDISFQNPESDEESRKSSARSRKSANSSPPSARSDKSDKASRKSLNPSLQKADNEEDDRHSQHSSVKSDRSDKLSKKREVDRNSNCSSARSDRYRSLAKIINKEDDEETPYSSDTDTFNDSNSDDDDYKKEKGNVRPKTAFKSRKSKR